MHGTQQALNKYLLRMFSLLIYGMEYWHSFWGFVLFVFCFFGCPVAQGVPGPGIRFELHCDLSCSRGNARSLTHGARPETEPASQHAQDTLDPVATQQDLLFGGHVLIPHRHFGVLLEYFLTPYSLDFFPLSFSSFARPREQQRS